MRPERPVPWLYVAAPYVLQQIVTVVLAVVLQPPSQAGGALYSVRFGVVILASYAVLVGATFVIAARYGDPRELLAIRRTPAARTVVIVVITFAVAALSTRLLEPIFHGVRAQGIDPIPFPGGAAAVIGLALTFVGVAIAGPVAEELYFRGLVQGALEPSGQLIAVAVTAVVFAAVHFVPAAIPVLFVYGVLLGLIRSRTSSIVPGAIAHALNNAVAIAVAIALA
jgi:membrane protease YdiL (CAAX protease family)